MPIKIKEIFERFSVEVWGDTVFINNRHFHFTYNKPDIIMPEYAGDARYFGGLQCEYERESNDYKMLENELVRIAENALKLRKQESKIEVAEIRTPLQKAELKQFKERYRELDAKLCLDDEHFSLVDQKEYQLIKTVLFDFFKYSELDL